MKSRVIVRTYTSTSVHVLHMTVFDVYFHSSAQLLEPFRLNHEIQLISGGPGGAGILSSSAGVPDLDGAPGASTPSIIPANIIVGPTTELEDPPGLYEKVQSLVHGGIAGLTCR